MPGARGCCCRRHRCPFLLLTCPSPHLPQTQKTCPLLLRCAPSECWSRRRLPTAWRWRPPPWAKPSPPACACHCPRAAAWRCRGERSAGRAVLQGWWHGECCRRSELSGRGSCRRGCRLLPCRWMRCCSGGLPRSVLTRTPAHHLPPPLHCSYDLQDVAAAADYFAGEVMGSGYREWLHLWSSSLAVEAAAWLGLRTGCACAHVAAGMRAAPKLAGLRGEANLILDSTALNKLNECPARAEMYPALLSAPCVQPLRMSWRCAAPPSSQTATPASCATTPQVRPGWWGLGWHT